MGNYRQHLTFASVCGLLYAVAAGIGLRMHWLYCTIAALLSTIGGLLPDIDSASGVEMRGFTSVVAILSALVVWARLAHSKVGIPIEAEIWAVVLTYYAVKHGLRKLASKLMIHRGISHSIPTLAVWVLLVYLHYPSDLHQLRVAMAVAVGLGVLSHLVLDEMFSVDLRNNHIKRSFGTALKLWSQSIWSTLGIYVLLSYLVWTSLEQWPNEPISNLVMQPIPAPRVPWPETKEGIDQVIQAKRDALEQAMRASKLPLPRLQLPSPGQPR